MGKSYVNLLQGYRNFKQQYTDGEQSVMHQLAVEGQQPEVMIVACCDSRVDPAVLLQCDPGDIFVARNVANIIPPYVTPSDGHAVGAALEYAVCYLKIKDLIIMGHSQCGGIDAILNQGALQQNDYITDWASRSGLNTDPNTFTDVNDAAKCSLHASYQNCLTYPWIQQRVSENELNIHQWFLVIKQGDVYEFDTTQEIFSLL